jgi:hypothetical protein
VHLRTLQGLLVISALVWALFPRAGVGVFASAQLLCLFTVWRKIRAARASIEPRLEELNKALTPEGVQWVQRFAFWYTARDACREWGTTLKMSSLLMLLLAPWLIIRALIAAEFTLLFMLGPAVLFFFVGVVAGGRLDLDELVNDEGWKQHKQLHEDATRVLALKETRPRAFRGRAPLGDTHG